jgi:hypothetical protein
MTSQRFNGHLSDSDAPGPDIVPITPDDDNDLALAVRALRANTGGTIKVTMFGVGATPVDRTLNFLAGETRVGQFVRVWATGTTADGIEGHV